MSESPLSARELRAAASEVRDAIVAWLQAHPEVSLSTNFGSTVSRPFPRDSCKAASLILGQVLQTAGPRDSLRLVTGKMGIDSHAWLRVGDFFIDLTADQFAGAEEPVIVSSVDDGAWFGRFAPFHEHPFELRHDHLFFRVATDVSKSLGERSR